MNDFFSTLLNEKYILSEGSIIDRLIFEYDLQCDPYILNSSVLYNPKCKEIMTIIYTQYINVAIYNRLPIIITTPTWQASTENIKKSRFFNKPVIEDSVSFVYQIRDFFPLLRKHIFIAGQIGPILNEDYTFSFPDEKRAYTYHKDTIFSLLENEIDFIYLSSFASLQEIIGCVKILSSLKAPYIIGCVIDKNGNLLDGFDFNQLVIVLDNEFEFPPYAYFITCTNPIDLNNAFKNFKRNTLNRLLGIMPGVYENYYSFNLSSDRGYRIEVNDFVEATKNLVEQYPIKIIGGSCGTDIRHINYLANYLSLKKQ
jgi:S-methylmethionine-dependent homocysteine/selenocysteine methylase